uniref:arginine--tRNA ligase domain-containing protein n=1 Tax=Lactobacillus jensenii TaxID=109790 RepID=UPI00286FD21A
SIYTTRDITEAENRKKHYDIVQALNDVGKEQSAYFEQLKEDLKKMGHNWADDIHQIPFGLITQVGKNLRTRKGIFVF